MSIHLCYNESKGLYVITDAVTNREPHISEHHEKGYNIPAQVMEIPNTGVTIAVKTKFAFSNSYLYADITMNGKKILNFFRTREECLDRIIAKQEDWSSLFNDIIRVYNNVYTNNDVINRWFDNMELIMDGINGKMVTGKVSYIGDKFHDSSCNIEDVIKNGVIRSWTTTTMGIIAKLAELLPQSIYQDNELLDKRFTDLVRKVMYYYVNMDTSVFVNNRNELEKSISSILNWAEQKQRLVYVLRQKE